MRTRILLAQEVENTVVQLIANLGVGGQALANPDRALTFAEDLSSAAATQAEMTVSSFGEILQKHSCKLQIKLLKMVSQSTAMHSRTMRSIGSFFKNIGFLVPVQMRDEMAI